MEFEAACVDRMREILLDLTTALGNVLRDARTATIAGEMKSGPEVPAWEDDFMEHLRAFNDIVNDRMKTKPAEKREREKYLQASMMGLKDAQARIRDVKAALNEERSKHEKKVAVISAEIDKEHSLLESIKASHATEINRQMKESEDQIRKVREETDAAIKLLQADIQSHEAHLEESLKARHMSNEGELYRERSKVEAEYLAALAKYDSDVGALHRRMESLTDQLHHLDEELTDFRHELAVQDVRYVELKEERALALLKAFTDELEKFCENRAAKVIQRFWRSYYERWCMRRKKKSKKKKQS